MATLAVKKVMKPSSATSKPPKVQPHQTKSQALLQEHRRKEYEAKKAEKERKD